MEISEIFCHSDFTWNQSWESRVSFCHFNTLRESVLWFLWIFELFEGLNLPNKFTKLTVPKMALLEYLVSPKWISRKIWVARKLWNFHTVSLQFTKNIILKLWVSPYWCHVKQFLFFFFYFAIVISRKLRKYKHTFVT